MKNNNKIKTFEPISRKRQKKFWLNDAVIVMLKEMVSQFQATTGIRPAESQVVSEAIKRMHASGGLLKKFKEA